MAKYENKNKKQDKNEYREMESDVLGFQGGGKIPPHSREVEMNVIGGIIMDNSLIDMITGIVRPEMFYVSANQDIYAIMLDMRAKSTHIDLITLAEELKNAGKLESIGGPFYLAELSSAFSSVDSILYSADKIKELWVKRDMILLGHSLSEQAFDPSIEAEDLVGTAQKDIISLGQELYGNKEEKIDKVFITIVEEAEERANGDNQISGIPTGYAKLDELIGGWQPELYIIAGRPSHGKTSLMVDTAWHTVDIIGKKVGIFSIEMSMKEIARKFIANDTKIDMSKFKYGNLTDEDFKKMAKSAPKFTEYRERLIIEDKNPISILEIQSKARLWKAKYDIDMIMVDYIQIAETAGHGRRIAQNRNDEITLITKGLLQMKKELEIPVIALSQLSREIDKRAEGHKRPQLSDLRDGGSIEQDADTVLFIYRPEMYMSKDDPKFTEVEGLAEMSLAKQRNGPTGDFKLHFLHKWGSFTER